MPRCPAPLFVAVTGVALTLGSLLVGYEPVGDDPILIYRPIKSELALAMRSGMLPFWSDRFGVGVPLVAESHAGAFYPPNWLYYRLLETPKAYRLAMWLHYAALAGTTYLFGRTLRLQTGGAALAALSVALCGFSASHAVHEWYYQALPYLLLTLTVAERYLARGGAARLAGVALILGAALTIGHFQIQCWTAGLVLVTATWRAIGREAPWHRVAALSAAICWAGAIAAVQLVATGELVHFVGYSRSISELFLYSFPTAHWAQLAFPGVFHALRDPAHSAYWFSQATSAREVCLSVGVVPLIFAAVGFFAHKDRSITLWCGLAVLGFGVAALPGLWPAGYAGMLRIPGLNLFRCPARYTLLTSLGLCLLAGVGFDRTIPAGRFRAGIGLAAVFAVAAAAWIVAWPSWAAVFAAPGGDMRPLRLAVGMFQWCVALGLVAAWRAGRVPAWVLLAAATCELAFWFYNGPTEWGPSIRYPDDSPVLSRLAREPGVGLVAGVVCDLPVLAGRTTGDPYLGIAGPMPNPLLDMVALTQRSRRPHRVLLRRLGVTHGIFDRPEPFLPGEAVYRGTDPVLDVVLARRGAVGRRDWRLERYPGAFPAARAATRERSVPEWPAMLLDDAAIADPTVVFFRDAERPEAAREPRARAARVIRWDGRSGEVEHDGTCDLVIRRACYPGWTARLDGARPARIVPADGGVQSIRLTGSGVTRVEVSYRPILLWPSAAMSLAAVVAAAGVITATALGRRGASRAPTTRPDVRAPGAARG